jgi:hypothetical protein
MAQEAGMNPYIVEVYIRGVYEYSEVFTDRGEAEEMARLFNCTEIGAALVIYPRQDILWLT